MISVVQGERGLRLALMVALAVVASRGIVSARPALAAGNAALATQARPTGSPAGSPVPPNSADAEAVAAVARRLNCPLCQGRNLLDCPLVVCSQMRDVIAQQLASGASASEIIADFVAQYGPQVLNEPPRSGFQLVAWILPVVVLMATGALAVSVVTRDRRLAREGAAMAPTGAVTTGAADRVSEDARERVEDLVARQ